MPLPRVLIINPNTSTEITERVRLLAVEEAGCDAAVDAVTAPFGARYIASRTGALIAGHAAIDAYAASVAADGLPDAVVIACFGDPGIESLRELAPVPVLGFAETGIQSAARESGSFVIVTAGAAWRDMLIELVASLGLASRLAGIVLLGDEHRRPDAAARLVNAEARRLGAARVLPGGTGLIPLIPQLALRLDLPIIDPHRLTIRAAILAARGAQAAGARSRSPSVGSFGGLSPLLTRLLQPVDAPLSAAEQS